MLVNKPDNFAVALGKLHKGSGSDTFEAENLTTKGSANFDFGDGQDVVKFTGIAAVIGANLSVAANAGGSSFASMERS